MKIGFYGAGNMAQAIIQGILASQKVAPNQLVVYNHRYEPTLRSVEEKYGITAILDEKSLFEKVDLIIFAVKPAVLLAILPKIKSYLQPNHLLVSIASGVSIQQITSCVGDQRIIRVMPNTPAMVGAAMSSVSANELVSETDLQNVVEILSSFGKAQVVPEELIPAVVGVSGSAPAYVYLFIEALADGAVAEGMPRVAAYEFAAQTVLGSAKMVLETGLHPGELKDSVCSPAGTTIAAVESLEKNHFRASVIEAVRTAAKADRKH